MLTLARFLRRCREDIMREWEQRSLSIASSREQSRKGRRDHLPQLLDAMASAIERLDSSDTSLGGVPKHHAEQRWHQDYELREIVAEYRILRRVLIDEYRKNSPQLSEEGQDQILRLSTLSENIDLAITEAVDHYQRQRDRTRDYFVGMFTHDLRDPLNVIALNAEILLLQEAVPAANSANVARIVANAARMKHLINDMLDVTRSRLGSGLPVSPVWTDLRRVVDQVTAEIESAFPARRIHIDVPRNCSGMWDPVRIAQALSNLMTNALKHGHDPVMVRAALDDEQLTVEVENRGTVASEVRDRIFEPFTSGDPGNGTGLGLYIVSEIARAHGGQLSLLPDTGDGTVFRLQLPRSVARAGDELSPR